MDIDEVQGGVGGGEATPAVSTPAPSTPAPSSPAPVSTPTPAPEWVGVREAVSGFGLSLPDTIKDDNQALAALAASYQEAARLRTLEPIAREYQQHQSQFQAWRQQQAEAAQKQQDQAKQWWKAPEFDPTWEQKLSRDPTTGEIRVNPGAPLDTAQKYLAWQDHQRSTLQRLAQNPLEVIKPGLQQMIQEEALKIVQQHLGGFQQQQSATSFVQENSGWIHQRDQQGNVVRDPQTGAPALSELGRRFAGYVYEAAQSGMDQSMQQRYAMSSVQRDYAIAQLQRSQAGNPAAGAAAQQQFLQQQAGARGPAVQGAAVATPAVVAPANGRPARTKRDLEELLMGRMKEKGFQPGTTVEV